MLTVHLSTDRTISSSYVKKNFEASQVVSENPTLV
jgi:hypothetical protein